MTKTPKLSVKSGSPTRRVVASPLSADHDLLRTIHNDLQELIGLFRVAFIEDERMVRKD